MSPVRLFSSCALISRELPASKLDSCLFLTWPVSSRVQCAGQSPHGHYLLNHTITSGFRWTSQSIFHMVARVVCLKFTSHHLSRLLSDSANLQPLHTPRQSSAVFDPHSSCDDIQRALWSALSSSLTLSFLSWSTDTVARALGVILDYRMTLKVVK